MAVEHINPTDSLNTGRGKLNAAIDQSNEALTKATSAETKANQALINSESTQTQLDTIIIESGTSDAEVLQARTKADGTSFPLLKDRLNEVDAQLADIAVNIKNYWSTTLEAALQAAHDALPPTGGIILIPQNLEVTLTNSINITKPNVCIMGISGKYGLAKIKGTTSNMTMFNVDNYGFTLKELGIYGDGVIGDSTTATIIPFKINGTVNGDADCFLENVIISQCKNAGEFKGRNIRIKNNVLVSNCFNGFRVLGGFTDMRGVEIFDVRFHSLGIGNNTGTKTSCIYIEPTANYKEVKINVYADDCEQVVSGAISSGIIAHCMSYRARAELFDIDNSLLTTPNSERQLKITDNSISFYTTNNGSYGMKLKGLGFQVNSNTIQRSSKHGIFADSVTDSEIHDNTISNCGYEANSDGIHLTVNSVRNTIKDNIVKKNDVNCITRYGICVEGSENQFDNNTTFGLPSGNEFYINPTTSKLAYGDTRSPFVKQRVTQGTSAPSSGRWLAGDICYNTSPTAEKNIVYWVCIVGGTPGTWRAVGIGQGTTANRPSLTNRDIGYLYFDTDLQKMLYYDGTGYK